MNLYFAGVYGGEEQEPKHFGPPVIDYGDDSARLRLGDILQTFLQTFSQ